MMRELADNILDIAQNSIAAQASLVEIAITVSHADNRISLQFRDNGRGMSPELLEAVAQPFTTTRKTRKVGLGLPLLQMTASMTGGSFSIESKLGEGTTVRASFRLDHIDRPPMGDIPGALYTLVLTNPDTDFLFTDEFDGSAFTFDTRAVRETIAPLPISHPDISAWIRDCLYNDLTELHGGYFS